MKVIRDNRREVQEMWANYEQSCPTNIQAESVTALVNNLINFWNKYPHKFSGLLSLQN